MAATTISATMIIVRKAAGPSPTLELSKSSPHTRQRGANFASPANSVCAPHCGHRPKRAARPTGGCPFLMSLSCVKSVRGDRRAPAAPDIDDDEEEQTHNDDEMPKPGTGIETEKPPRREVGLQIRRTSWKGKGGT